MKSRFKEFLNIVNPDPAIGGLEISDSALRLVFLHEDGSVARYAMVPLPAGVVAGGVVADIQAFRAACVSLRRGMGGFRLLPIIVSLPPASVYSQVFAVPAARPEQVEEAARLNLRMISPIEWEGAYADWQKISPTPNADGSVDALGAFVEARVADTYHASLSAAGFLPVAIEFASLSLARALAAAADMGGAEVPYLVVNLTGDGMTLLAVKSGAPQFTEFAGWGVFSKSATAGPASPSQGGQVTLAEFQSVLGAAIRRFVNFYRTRFHGDLRTALVVNATSNKEVAEWIKQTFAFEVFSLAGYTTLGKEWCVAAGAGLRGLIPRADDTFISLARVGTEDEFERNRVRRFISLWRTVALSVLGITAVMYIILDMLMVRRADTLAASLAGVGASAGNAEVAALAAQAANFNALADKALVAGASAVPKSGILRALYAAAGTRVTLTRIDLTAASRTVAIQGTATSEQAVIAFKGILENNPAVEDVSLPLSAITATPTGTASFSATITIFEPPIKNSL